MRGVLYRTESDGETPLAKPELKVSATKHNRVAYYKDETVKNEAFENGELKEGMIVMTAEDDLSTISSVPVATIITSVSDKAPSGYLLCDGNQYSQTTYPALYLAIGNKYNKEDTSEGYFCVPDLRELVLVGTGQNDTQEIEDHDVFELGEFKDDQLQAKDDSRTFRFISNSQAQGVTAEYTSINTLKISTWANAGIRAGTTTRTKQFGVNYFIKATSGELNEDDGVVVQKLMDMMTMDFSKAADPINLTPSAGWTAPSRGYAYVSFEKRGDGSNNLQTYVSLNGQQIGNFINNNSYSVGYSMSTLVNEGDILTTTTSGSGSTTVKLTFIPTKA